MKGNHEILVNCHSVAANPEVYARSPPILACYARRFQARLSSKRPSPGEPQVKALAWLDFLGKCKFEDTRARLLSRLGAQR